MVAPESGNLLTEMAAAVDGAQGLNENWLYEYAAEAEGYRVQLISAQDFIAKVQACRLSGCQVNLK